MWMAGYGSRERPSNGLGTDLWAKALVLEDPAKRRGLLITLDLIGIDRQLAASICRQLEGEYGLQRHQIAISTSHTHSGPVVGRNLAPLHYLLVDKQQQELIDRFAERLQASIVDVAGQAIDAMVEAQLSWGAGRATFAVNRRDNPAREVARLRVEQALRGPSDHDVPVLAVRDTKERLTAVLFGYACHATVLDALEWSGDFPGYAQQALEANHPDCVAMFFAGCGADQNPLPRRSVELAKHYGRRLANAVDAVLLTTQMQPLEAELTTRYREIDLPLGTLPTAAEVAADVESENQYVRARATILQQQLMEDGQLQSTYPYPVATWQLADQIQLVFLGGEVVVDYAARLKTELLGRSTWVAAYSNDVMAYVPSRRVLAEGGYEGGGAMVYYGLPSPWAPEVEEMIVAAVKESLRGD
jgi:hypothetical protein